MCERHKSQESATTRETLRRAKNVITRALTVVTVLEEIVFKEDLLGLGPAENDEGT